MVGRRGVPPRSACSTDRRRTRGALGPPGRRTSPDARVGLGPPRRTRQDAPGRSRGSSPACGSAPPSPPSSATSSERSTRCAEEVEHVVACTAPPLTTASAASSEKRAGEHGEPGQDGPLRLGQQVEAPVDRRPQRPVPRQRRAAAAGQEPEPVVEASRDLGGRQRADPRGGQLDRQRDAIQPAADLRDRVRVGGGQLEARLRPLAPGRRTGAPRRNSRDRREIRRPRVQVRQRHRGHRDAGSRPEMPSASRLVARTCSRGQRRSSSSAISTTGSMQVLAVVEDQQQLAVGDALHQGVDDLGVGPLLDAQRRGDRVVDQSPSVSERQSSTSHTPSGWRSTRWAPISSASRVFPTPPVPVSVTKGRVREALASAAAISSAAADEARQLSREVVRAACRASEPAGSPARGRAPGPGTADRPTRCPAADGRRGRAASRRPAARRRAGCGRPARRGSGRRGRRRRCARRDGRRCPT